MRPKKAKTAAIPTSPTAAAATSCIRLYPGFGSFPCASESITFISAQGKKKAALSYLFGGPSCFHVSTVKGCRPLCDRPDRIDFSSTRRVFLRKLSTGGAIHSPGKDSSRGVVIPKVAPGNYRDVRDRKTGRRLCLGSSQSQ